MAIYGSPFSAPFGDPECHITQGSLRVLNGQVRVTFTPKDDLAERVWFVYVQGRGFRRDVEHTGQQNIQCGRQYGLSVINCAILAGAYQMSLGASMLTQARTFDRAAQHVLLSWDWTAECLLTPAALPWVTAWSMTGLRQATNCEPADLPSRGHLQCKAVVNSGTLTVTLFRTGTAVASGSEAYSGSTLVHLTELNDSGLAGDITFSPGLTGTTWIELTVRWPAAMNIYRGTSSPPGTAVTQAVREPGSGEGAWLDLEVLDADVYYYAMEAVSDTGEAGSRSAPQSAEIFGTPVAPAGLAYLSGDSTSCVLRFQASTTAPGLTHRLYLQPVALGAPPFNDPFAEVISADDGAWAAGTAYGMGDYRRPVTWNGLRYEITARTGDYKSGPSEPAWPATEGETVADNHVTWTCRGYQATATSLGVSGRAYVWLRAVNAAGIEEKNANALPLDFDGGGAYYEPPPNTPLVNAPEPFSVTEGLLLTVNGAYSGLNALSTATALQLFTRAPGGAYDYDTPADTQLLTDSGSHSTATLTTTLAAGWNYFKLLAVTASGIQSPAADAPEYAIYASEEAPAAPDFFLVRTEG